MTDETRAELRRGIGMLVNYAAGLPDDPERPGYADVRHNDRHCVVEVWLPSKVAIIPLTAAQQLALSVLLGEPDTVIQSALADMLLDMGHEYATAVAEKARAEEREKPAHLSPGSAVTVYGMSGHVRDMNMFQRLNGLTECEIRVVLLTGREASTGWPRWMSDDTD